MASSESQLRAGEIKEVLLREIEHFDQEMEVEEVGEVLEVKDGVARIYGLTKAMASEMLEITSSESGDTVPALALNLEEDNIGAVIMGDWTVLQEGDAVRRTNRVLDIGVGSEYLGRVVDALGEPIDGQGADPARGPSPDRHCGARHREAAAGERAASDGDQGHRLHDPHRPRPARADHRRPRHGQDRHRARHDHQPA